MTIWRNVKKDTDHATSLNRNKGNSGRRFTVRTQDTIDAVQVAIQNNPRGVTCGVNGLVLTNSKMEILSDKCDFVNGYSFKTETPAFYMILTIGDEAGFPTNGKVNNQNVRQYAPRGQAPEFTYQVSESRKKRTVWIGLCGDGSLIGPFFFERNVTGLTYLEILKEKVFPAVLGTFPRHFVNGSFQRLWWAQDGAPAHRTAEVREWLTEFFSQRIIALNHPVEWPPRSPDLTPCDFFLWGYLKSKVYTSPPATIDDLIQRIEREVETLKRNPRLVRRAVHDMIRRVNLCVESDGRHIEG